jgi:hypothetical protein
VSKLNSLLVLMNDNPPTLHTHSKSSLYIYTAPATLASGHKDAATP